MRRIYEALENALKLTRPRSPGFRRGASPLLSLDVEGRRCRRARPRLEYRDRARRGASCHVVGYSDRHRVERKAERGSEGGERMQVEQYGTATAAEPDEVRAELASLRATCRRQAWVVDTMTRVLVNLRVGVRALKAENAELRAWAERAHGVAGSPASASSECFETCL